MKDFIIHVISIVVFMMLLGNASVYAEVIEEPVCSCQLDHEAGQLCLQNMKSGFYNSAVLRFYKVKAYAAAELGEDDECTGCDVGVIFDKAEFRGGGASEEASAGELIYKPFGESFTLPDSCRGLEVYGLNEGGEYELISEFSDNAGEDEINEAVTAANGNSYYGIKYIFKDCSGAFQVDDIYPMAAVTFDSDAHNIEPEKVVFSAKVQVDGVKRAEGSCERVVDKSSAYGVVSSGLVRGWTLEGNRRTEIISNNAALHDMGYGTIVRSITTRLTMPDGVTADSVVALSSNASRYTDYTFADTGIPVNYGFIMNRTNYHVEKNGQGKNVFVAVTEFSDRPVATSYTKESNGSFYNLKVKTDDDVFDMIGASGTSGEYTLESEWDLVSGKVTASTVKNFSLPVVNASAYDGTLLMVQKGNGFTEDEAVIKRGAEYTYKFRFANAKCDSRNIVFYCNIEGDSLEGGYEWHGLFSGLDIGGVCRAGAKPQIYYSDDRSQARDINAEGWIPAEEWQMKLSDVRSFAVDFEDYCLQAGKPVIVLMNMRAPDEGKTGSKLKNSFSVTCDKDFKGESNGLVLHLNKVMPEYDELAIVKKIKTDDYWKYHGDITSIFKITSCEDTSKVWYDSITFTSSDIKEGINEMAVYEYLPLGSYYVEEVGTSRFVPEAGELSGNGTWLKSDGGIKAFVELDADEYESVTFTGKKVNWKGFSHNDICINDLGVM